MMTTIIVVMVIYFAGMVGISFMGKKYAQNFDSYLNMGRSGSLILIMGGAIGAHIGNGFVVGGAGEGAAVGMGGALYGIGCALSYVILSFGLNNFVYKNGYLSLADYLRARYRTNLPAIIFNLSTVFSYLGILGAQLLAGKALFVALGLNGTVGVVVIAVVVLLYSQISGLWGAYATSVIQTAVIFVGLIATTAILLARGGVGVIADAVSSGVIPSTVLSPIGYDSATMVLLVIPTCMSIFTDQCSFQRINSASSAKTSQRAHLLSAVLMIPLAIMPAFIGLYGAAAFGASGNEAFFSVVLNVLPPIATALIITAVIAAVMSTIDGAFIAFSAMLIKDLYKGYVKPDVSDKQMKSMTTVLNIIIAVFGIVIALVSSSIVSLLSATYVFLASSCLIPFLGGRIWKRGNGKGAAASSIVGMIVVILNMLGILPLPYASIFPILPALVVYIIVSLATKEEPAPEASIEA